MSLSPLLPLGWLSSRINLPEEDWPRPNHPDNFAILAIGPGGNETTRAEAALILTALSRTSRAQGTRVVFPETQRVLSFMRLAAAGTLLLHVYAQGDDVDDDEELFERLMTVDPEALADSHDWALLNALGNLFVAEQVVMADLAVARAEQPHLARPHMVVTVGWRVVDDEEEESSDGESEAGGSDGEAPDPDVEVPNDDEFGVAIADAEELAFDQEEEISDEELARYNAIQRG
jgi:hypothetical protein